MSNETETSDCSNIPFNQCVDFCLFGIKKNYSYCFVFGYIAALVFGITSVKSIYDLIVSEIIHRDVPLTRLTWKKTFHLLLPVAQICHFVCTLVFNGFCVPMNNQLFPHNFLTAVSGYIIILCSFLNGLQWSFLAYKKFCTRHSIKIYMLVALVFIILPFIPVTLVSVFIVINNYDPDRIKKVPYFNIHMSEAIYNSLLNLIVIFTLIFSYISLRRQMKEILSPSTLKRVKTKLSRQMTLYISFFLFRTVCLFTSSVWYMALTEKIEYLPDKEMGGPPYFFCPRPIPERNGDVGMLVGPGVFFFLQAVGGDAVLALIMLYYLQYRGAKKPVEGGEGSEEYRKMGSVRGSKFSHTHVGERKGTHFFFSHQEGINATDDMSYQGTPSTYNSLKSDENTPILQSAASFSDSLVSTNSHYMEEEKEM